jgi:hypothetical protein
MSDQKTMVDSTTQRISDKALENLTTIEDEIEQSSNYFKPKPDKVYMLSINPEERFIPRFNEKFKDPQGRPTIRYEVKITHINSGKEQLWEVSKTVSIQLIEVLKKGFRVVQVQRFGEDRGTVYKVQGVQ